MSLPKIYLFAGRDNSFGPGYAGFALAEDGTGICGHFSSSIGFAKHDLGLTSDWKHEYYEKHYPNGYELEWVDDPYNHAKWRVAYRLNQLAKNARVEGQGGDSRMVE